MRRRSIALPLVIVVAFGAFGATAALGSACTTFDESPPEPSGEGGNASDANGTSDASGTSDAGDGLRFCERTDAAFCADFDEGPLDKGWAGKTEERGLLELVPSEISAPSALQSSAGPVLDSDAGAGPPSASARLAAQIPHQQGRATRVVLAFDVRVDEATGAPPVIAGIGFDSENSFVSLTAGGSFLGLLVVDTVRDAGVTSAAGKGIALKQWHHVEIEARYTGGVRVLVDGVEFVKKDGVGLSDLQTDLFASVGVYIEAPGNQTKVRYDNVVATEQP